MDDKRKKQRGRLGQISEGKWYAIGDSLRVCFRFRSSGVFELLGKLRSSEEIEVLCESLAKHLHQEYAVHKRYNLCGEKEALGFLQKRDCNSLKQTTRIRVGVNSD